MRSERTTTANSSREPEDDSLLGSVCGYGEVVLNGPSLQCVTGGGGVQCRMLYACLFVLVESCRKICLTATSGMAKYGQRSIQLAPQRMQPSAAIRLARSSSGPWVGEQPQFDMEFDQQESVAQRKATV